MRIPSFIANGTGIPGIPGVAMRALLRLLPVMVLAGTVLTLSTPVAHAQEQERKLVDRIMRPDQGLDYLSRHRTYTDRNRNPQLRRAANVNTFNFQQRFYAKAFSTGNYRGSKDFSQRDRRYASEAARVPQTETLRRAVRAYDTEAVPVQAAREAGKTQTVKTYATRESRLRGRSQDKIDIQGPAAMDTIVNGSFTELKTIDDVRNLLNKNE